jgi:hypothetical protein
MKPVESLQEAIRLLETFAGQPSEFQLAFPDSLNDPTGVNLAIMTDRALGRGWQPDGYVQEGGYRILRYKPL